MEALEIIFVQISICICLNCQIYLFKLTQDVDFEKRAWNSHFNGGLGKRAWNSHFNGGLGILQFLLKTCCYGIIWVHLSLGQIVFEGKRAWNSNFNGGIGKRAWNKGFTGNILFGAVCQNILFGQNICQNSLTIIFFEITG